MLAVRTTGRGVGSVEVQEVNEPRRGADQGVVETAQVMAGDNVAITGPGPIGLLALQLAKVAGATVIVIGTDQDTERLRMAEGLGADGVINVQRVDNVVEAAGDIFHAE